MDYQHKLMPSDILDEVLEVLLHSSRGKGDARHYLTAYQILDRLDPEVRQRLIAERGMPGAGSGHPYRAAQVVSDAAEMLRNRGKVDIAYLDSEGATFTVQGQQVKPGYELSGLYRAN